MYHEKNVYDHYRTMEQLQQDLCMPREHEVALLKIESNSQDDHASKCSILY